MNVIRNCDKQAHVCISALLVLVKQLSPCTQMQFARELAVISDETQPMLRDTTVVFGHCYLFEISLACQGLKKHHRLHLKARHHGILALLTIASPKQLCNHQECIENYLITQSTTSKTPKKHSWNYLEDLSNRLTMPWQSPTTF